MSDVPNITLHDSVEIPQLGFGVFQIPPDDTQEAVEIALDSGYRHIDTAAAHRNERAVGAAIAASGIPRQEIFVTTKLWNSEQGFDSTLSAFEASLGRLDTGFVDLYLIPLARAGAGPVRRHLAGVRAHSGRRRCPHDRRLELPDRGSPTARAGNGHTADGQPNRASPMAPATRASRLAGRAPDRDRSLEPARAGGEALEDDTISGIAAAHGKTPAQAILRWHLQLGNVVFPKSVTPERIRENFELFDFELSEGEMERFDALDRGDRIGPEPATFAAP